MGLPESITANVTTGHAGWHQELHGKLNALLGTSTDDRFHDIGGVLRNFGSGAGYWAVLDDADHTPMGITSAASDTSKITVTFDATGVDDVTLIAVPDETLASQGYVCGVSLGLGTADIYTYRPSRTNLQGVILSGGADQTIAAGWSIENGTFVSFTGGVLTISHAACDGYDLDVFPYPDLAGTGTLAPAIARTLGGATPSVNSQICWTDSDGNIVTGNGLHYRARWKRGQRSAVPAENPQTFGESPGNIWLFGRIKTAA